MAEPETITRSPSATPDTDDDHVIVLSRTFDAPRELVFRAFTDPAHLPQWWGPRGFTVAVQEIDVHPGGVWRFMMHGPDGVDYPNWIAYQEITAPERIVYAHGGAGDEPEFHVSIRFDDEGGRTRLTMRMRLPSAEARARVVGFGAIELGHQTMDKLAEHLPLVAADADAAGDVFAITRVFAARRDRVFRAWTDREHLMRWWGPAGFTVIDCANDPRPGGRMHYRLRGPAGVEMWGKWEYREIVVPERLAFVSSFSDPEGGTTRPPFDDPWPAAILVTLTFDEQHGRTIVTLRSVPVDATEEERRTFREGNSSMRDGWGGTLDQLAAHLAQAPAG
jgi:uncharacterized protein YndB with AHSA1/START domain